MSVREGTTSTTSDSRPTRPKWRTFSGTIVRFAGMGISGAPPSCFVCYSTDGLGSRGGLGDWTGPRGRQRPGVRPAALARNEAGGRLTDSRGGGRGSAGRIIRESRAEREKASYPRGAGTSRRAAGAQGHRERLRYDTLGSTVGSCCKPVEDPTSLCSPRLVAAASAPLQTVHYDQ